MSSPQFSQDSSRSGSYERVDQRGLATMDVKKDDHSQQQTQTQPENLGHLQPKDPQISQDASEFEYELLERRDDRPSIRLVTILPGDRQDFIKLELKHTTFAERPKYEALSYTWGRGSSSYVQINGKMFSVTKNLFGALKHFRDKITPILVWIDAICINQRDDAEKSWQIQLMADIYRRAKQVLIWLGYVELYDLPSSSLGDIQSTNDLERSKLCWHPYWTRVWIVQEVCAAIDIEIHWDTLTTEPPFWFAKSEPWDSFFANMPRDGLVNRATDLAQQREARYEDSFLLPNLIESCSQFDCQLPHDKIYGFVGIALDCEEVKFPVDYTKSLWEVYKDIIRFYYNSVHFGESKSLVRFSRLILKGLGDVESPPTLEAACISRIEIGGNFFKVTGIYGGEISILGPMYDELAGNPSSTRTWNLALRKCTRDYSQLRAENDKFIATILSFEDSQVFGAASLISSFAWKGSGEHLSFRVMATTSISDKQQWCLSNYRLFATKAGKIGLAHVELEIGDKLYHFWDSDAVAVVKEKQDGTQRVLSKALLAEQNIKQQTKKARLEDIKVTNLFLGISELYDLTR